MLVRRSTVALVALAMAGCTTAAPAALVGSTSSSKSPSITASPSAKPTPPPHRWPSLQPPAGLAWEPLPGSKYYAKVTIDHGQVTLLWLDQHGLKFRYVPGFAYPEGSPRTNADTDPTTWVPKMVAAFDGAFKLADHVGGYYYLGSEVSPLLPGYATLVLYQNGVIRLGKWGRDLHLTPNMLMVRQNLPPFVDNGMPQTKPTDSYKTWGFTFNHRWLVNRSALGQLPDGSLIFAYGHNVRPATMAQALASAGVTFAIDLDMNGYFPAGFLYRHANGQVIGARLNPYVVHSPSIYFKVYQKDFFAVLPH